MNARAIASVVFLILIVIAIVSSYGWFGARKDLREARSTIAVLEASVEAYRASAENVQEVLYVEGEQRQVINHALESNQDWANTAVPADVVNGLCSKTRNCKTNHLQTPSN